MYKGCFVLVIAVLSLISCGKHKRHYKSPEGYDFAKAVMIKLPGEMNEISGIAYYPKDNSLLIECDGKGSVYKMALNNLHKIARWKFGKSRDYEDILVLDSTIYLLHSAGELTRLFFDGAGRSQQEDFKFADTAGNEFEAAYFDSISKNIIILCKKCVGEQDETVPTYAFNTETATVQPWKSLNLAGIKKDLDDESKVKVKPSAAGRHPITGELYVISSIDKVLVIADSDFNFKKAYKLNPDLFKQPEGITFSPQGDLFISNEGANSGNSNILFFRYKNESHKK